MWSTCVDQALSSRGLPALDSRAGKLLETPVPGIARSHAQVAQLVEHVTENHGVAGSIPALGTKLQ